jgi:hypothetical protein
MVTEQEEDKAEIDATIHKTMANHKINNKTNKVKMAKVIINKDHNRKTEMVNNKEDHTDQEVVTDVAQVAQVVQVQTAHKTMDQEDTTDVQHHNNINKEINQTIKINHHHNHHNKDHTDQDNHTTDHHNNKVATETTTVHNKVVMVDQGQQADLDHAIQ